VYNIGISSSIAFGRSIIYILQYNSRIIFQSIVCSSRFGSKSQEDLVLPGTGLVDRRSESAEAKAVVCKGTVGNGTEDLVSLTLASRAGNKASLEVEVAERVAVAGSLLAEGIDDGASGDVRRVRNGVAEGTVGADVDLLATRNNNTHGEGLVTACEDGGVARRAGSGANRLDRAVRGWAALAAEVEVSAASSQRLEVDGRCAASRDDAEVRALWGGRWRGRRVRTGGRGSAGGGHGAGEEGSESGGVLHFGGVGGAVWGKSDY